MEYKPGDVIYWRWEAYRGTGVVVEYSKNTYCVDTIKSNWPYGVIYVGVVYPLTEWHRRRYEI